MIHHEYFIRGQDKVIKLHPTHCPYNYFLLNNLKRVGEKLCFYFFLNCSVIFIDDVFKSQYASECIDWKSNKASRTCMVYVLFNAHGFITHQSTINEVQSFFKDSKPNLFWNYNILKYNAHWQTHWSRQQFSTTDTICILESRLQHMHIITLIITKHLASLIDK